MNIIRWWITFFVVAAVLLGSSSPLYAEQIHQQYEELLQAHVANGLVDYQGLKLNETKLDDYLKTIGTITIETLSADERLAFYINGYNAYTLKLILDNFNNNKPVSSIKKIGGFFTSPWKISFASLGGQKYSLDNIEHDLIRKQFDEPRIHFAVNCASMSCPVLIAEPYYGVSIDEQLERSTRAFLADPEMNYLKGDTLYLSSIFKWYSEDFDDDPVTFFLEHSDAVMQKQVRAIGSALKIKYLDYDWSLNDKKHE